MKKRKMKKRSKSLVARKPKQAPPPMSFDPEIIDVIRQSIAPNLTNAELKVYLGVCRKYNADPIMKDIVPVIFKNKKTGQRTLNFIITKNFLFKTANREDKLDGLQSKVLRNAKGDISGASAICWKKGCSHPFETEVSFKEYYNSRNEIWGQFPGAMIKKVAEVVVLKQAFGIDMLCDIEKEKMVQINDIEIPKTKFVVSDAGRVNQKKIEEGEIL